MVLEDGQVAQFKALGFLVLPRYLNSKQLDSLREECAAVERHYGGGAGVLTQQRCAVAEQRGCIFEALADSNGNSRQAKQLRTSTELAEFRNRSSWLRKEVHAVLLQGDDSLASIARQLLQHAGSSKNDIEDQRICLFNEQYIIKPQGLATQSAFSWHYDSAWCTNEAEYRPYVSVWCALDEVNAKNGTLFILPFQTQDKESNKKISNVRVKREVAARLCQEVNQGQQQFPSHLEGELCLELPAGSVVVMDDTLVHCSRGNHGDAARRAYMPQFSLGEFWEDDTQMNPLGLVICAD